MKSLNTHLKPGSRKETVVFVHGNSSSIKIFDPVFASDSISYTMLRMDLPGHGDSYRSDEPDAYSVAEYTSCLLDLINTREDDILLVGNSLGGHLCMEIAPHVDQLKGMVIFGAPPLKRPLNVEEAFNPFPMMANMFIEEVPEESAYEMFSAVAFNKKIVRELVGYFYHADPRVRSALGKTIAAGELTDEASVFSELPLPKYVLHGDLDATPNLNYIKSLNSPDHPFEVIELENCGHYPTVDQPEVFTQHLIRICEKVFD